MPHRLRPGGLRSAARLAGRTGSSSGGTALPTDTTRSLRSVNFPGRYAAVRPDSLGYLDPVTSSSTTAVKQSATFTIVPGLADGSCYSFRDTSGRYLRHYNYELRLDPSQDSATFRADSSFTAVSPWA